MNTTITPDFLRPKQAAEYFGLSVSFFRQAAMNRTLPSYRLGKARYFRRSEIEKIIAAGREV